MILPESGIDLLVTHLQPTTQVVGSLTAALLQQGVAFVSNVVEGHPVFGTHLVGKLRETRLPLRVVLCQDERERGVLRPDLLNRYLTLFRSAPALVLLVKAFLHQRSLKDEETGGFSSLLVFMMVIRFDGVGLRVGLMGWG